MKKVILSLVLLLSVAGAQTASAFGFDWGVTAGMNLTKMKVSNNGSKLFDSENRAGWFVGPKVNLSLIAGFGLDGALLYSQMKYNTSYTAEAYANSTYSTSETVRSLSVPINLKYSIGLGSIANVYLTTGPQFDFMMGDKDSDFVGNVLNTSFEQENMTTSWNVGAGVKLLSHLDVGVGYNFGLSDAAKQTIQVLGNATGVNLPTTSTNIRANTFKVQLTYYF